MNLKPFLLLISLPLLSQCHFTLFPDRIVQQGTYLPESKVKQLKVGMSKAQVETILGSSLLSSTFDKERVDYAFTYKKGSDPMRLKHLSLSFQHNRLANIDFGQ